MNNLLRNTSYILLATSVAFISACSSSSDGTTSAAVEYAGNLDPATIDDLNALALGTAAGEAVQVASSSTGLPAGISISSGASIDLLDLNEIIISTAGG